MGLGSMGNTLVPLLFHGATPEVDIVTHPPQNFLTAHTSHYSSTLGGRRARSNEAGGTRSPPLGGEWQGVAGRGLQGPGCLRRRGHRLGPARAV